MSIQVGAAGISKVMVGGTAAKAVYLGTQQVWTAKKKVALRSTKYWLGDGSIDGSTFLPVALPVHQPGDLIVAFSYRSGATAPPGLPAGWTSLIANTGNSSTGGWMNSLRVGYMVATRSNHDVGTWANGAEGMVAVFSGQAKNPFGWFGETGGTSNVANFPTPTMVDSSGFSQLLYFYGAYDGGSTLGSTAPGYTVQQNNPGTPGQPGARSRLITKDDTSSVGLFQQTRNVNFGVWRAATVEILAN